MSSRAAWRLETLGFAQVFDYADGKLDWMATGLPTEGTNATKPRAGDLAHKDTPTCPLTERLSDVRDRVRSLDWDAVVESAQARRQEAAQRYLEWSHTQGRTPTAVQTVALGHPPGASRCVRRSLGRRDQVPIQINDGSPLVAGRPSLPSA